MAISVFPAGGGEFVTNDFVVDMNDTSNNVIDLGRAYAQGAYDISLASGDTSFDIYAIDANGDSVGYTKDATMVTTGEFTTLAILGVAQDERITFAFAGASNDATSEGDAPGAGAYLESITPSDLPNIDDTANVVGGNFATDVEIYFESGAVSTPAKNITRSDSTALIVTRPDELDPDLDPYDLRAINPGVTPPTGTNAHILAGTVTAGATPVWVTTSLLTLGQLSQSYTETLEATDADGSITYSITVGTLPTGLSLDSSTGVISGTPSTGSSTFTARATDEGGNFNEREFELPIQPATGGVVTQDGSFIVHTFDSSGDFEVFDSISDVEYVVLSGGGSGGAGSNQFANPGGGGGGGLRVSVGNFSSGGGASTETPISTVSAGTYTVTIGAGGAAPNTINSEGSDGSSSSFGNLVNTTGGGGGGAFDNDGRTGGSGGGNDSRGNSNVGGSGTSGEGFAGGGRGSESDSAGGGGGAGAAATFTNSQVGGDGGAGLVTYNANAGWGAGGGGASVNQGGSGGSTFAGDGGTGPFQNNLPHAGGDGTANFGGAGGGAGRFADSPSSFSSAGSGGSGKVIIRYEA